MEEKYPKRKQCIKTPKKNIVNYFSEKRNEVIVIPTITKKVLHDMQQTARLAKQKEERAKVKMDQDNN